MQLYRINTAVCAAYINVQTWSVYYVFLVTVLLQSVFDDFFRPRQLLQSLRVERKHQGSINGINLTQCKWSESLSYFRKVCQDLHGKHFTRTDNKD